MKNTRKIGLQLFAGNPNTNTTGSATLSGEMKTYYDTELLKFAQPNLIYRQFAKKQPLPKGKGKTVEFRKFNSYAPATTPLTEGITPDGQSMKVTTLSATISQYGDYTAVSDVLETTAIDPVINECVEAHSDQAAMTLDIVCRNEIMAGNQVFYAPKKDGTEVASRDDLDETCVITADLVSDIAAFLKKNNAPKIDGDYIAIVHPYVANDLSKDALWIDVNKYNNGGKAIYEGEIGKLKGVRFVETTNAKIWENTTKKKVFGTLFIGRGAYADIDLEGGNLQVIVKSKGSAGTADPLDQRSTVGWKASAVSKIIQEDYIVRLETCVSRLGDTVSEN